MAVGPAEPVASWVTGGTGALPTRGATLASPLFHCDQTEVAGVEHVARLHVRARGARIAIVGESERRRDTFRQSLMKRGERGQTGHVSNGFSVNVCGQ